MSFYVTTGKRLIDFVAAAALLTLLAPVLIGVAVLVRWRLGAPVLFVQERPGQAEKVFKMLKFRTMRDARNAEGELLPDRERLTDFGAFLRRTSLDELPELWNVLRGEMSLVGPRPLLVRYLPHYSVRERLRFAVRPGITGLAQVSGRNSLSWDVRLACDVEYVENCSLSLDVRILARTLVSVLAARDVTVAPDTAMDDLDVERRSRR